ncbi:MAG: PSD1 and planctomycete cytochrome C domain-containing protein [Planctomyces sp.]
MTEQSPAANAGIQLIAKVVCSVAVRMAMVLASAFGTNIAHAVEETAADVSRDAAKVASETSENSSTAEKIEFFESRIRPVLVEHCYSCHSHDAKNIRGGLLVDLREGLIQGGESGPAVIPGDIRSGHLLSAIRYESLQMPPEKKLPESVIRDFEQWIADGAVDPRDGELKRTSAALSESDIEKGREFWSFRPVTRPEIPEVHSDWAVSPIDRFVAEVHQREGVAPSVDASPDMLLRRLNYVLVGLPATPAERDLFLQEWAIHPEDAISRRIDQLLESPRFGERWGRHWLDVTRFAESSGGGRSLMFPEAWRFRDYVIQSFNQDKRFDQLLREHIAGDLLPAADDEQRDLQRTGAGYLILGAINYEEQDKEALRMDVVDEQIDTLGRTFLGMTFGCARCHDHKFDPIPTADYYALAGIFRSTRSLTPGNVSGYVTAPLSRGADPEAMRRWQEEIDLLKKQIADAKANPVSADQQKELKRLNDLLKKQTAAKPYVPTVMTVEDEEKPADWHIHIRGTARNLGPVVPRGFPQVMSFVSSRGDSEVGGIPDGGTTLTSAAETAGLASEAIPIPGKHSGRRELAEWLADPRHPLTARVFVNRVWMHLIGEGLVRTPDNFGSTGERATHPELLDYLADTFVHEDDWSPKRLIRRICTSRTFRMSSVVDSETRMRDPENRLLARGFRRQMDAETLRDSLLAIGGNLNLQISGGLTIGKIMEYDVIYDHQEYPLFCRSVYVPYFRNAMLDLFYAFDSANPNVVAGRRNEGTLPSQALFMMNSPFVIHQSELATDRLLRQIDDSDAARSAADELQKMRLKIRHLWITVLTREPTEPEERLVLEELLNDASSGQPQPERWKEIVHSLVSSVDFRFLD